MKRLTTLTLSLLMLFAFCSCSSNQTFEKYCWNCGEGITKDASFCEHCGAKINHAQEESKATNTEESNQPENSYDEDGAIPNMDDSSGLEISDPYEDISTETTSNSSETTAHTHTYSQKVITPTCTEQGYTTYSCICGKTYKSDYTKPIHNYINHICANCGAVSKEYSAFQTEYSKLTEEYNADVASLQGKISESQNNIAMYQAEINDARSSLATLSPSCPQWFLNQFIGNWQEYGSSYAATQAAQIAWEQQYNTDKALYENIISACTAEIQTEQININVYNVTISTRASQYNSDVNALKTKYGIA